MRLISPRAVNPFVINNKTDVADAAAIYEEVGRPSTSFFTVKTVEQQIMALRCKLREKLIDSRTQLPNQELGIFYEFCIITSQGKRYITNLLIKVGNQNADFIMLRAISLIPNTNYIRFVLC